MAGDGEAAVPEDGAFDGDAASGSMAGGVAPGGNDPMPAGDSQPPQDGGVMGAVGVDGTPASTPETGVNDKGGALPPEESGRDN